MTRHIYVCYVALHSESDWNSNQKAVLCALQTYDNYQQVGSVKYIARKTVSADLNEATDINSESVSHVAADEVM